MKTCKNRLQTTRYLTFLLVITLILLNVFACKTDKKQAGNGSDEIKKENVVEIITQHMDFQMQDTLPSGWNIFRYKNQSPQTHFFIVEKYPEGKTLEDVKTWVIPYFDSGMKLINEGKTEEGFAEFDKLPKWFGDVKFLGGMGLVSPGNTTETMIKLDPGHYFMECYVKMSSGVFHSSMGMIREFYVSDKDSGNKEFKADYPVTLSSTEGIVFDTNIKPGIHIFSVFFKDQKVYENFSGHDINLAKIDETADLVKLEQWMNWVDPKGLIEPAPKGVNFLGGVNNMPAGNTGYFKADLEPGKYVLISEVPDASSKNLFKTFVVLD